MAQHTSRQRAHLLECHEYLNAMKEQGIETSITRQAADPAAFFRAKQLSIVAGAADIKPPKVLKIQEHSIAVRIQALALAEANISSELQSSNPVFVDVRSLQRTGIRESVFLTRG